MRTITCEHPNRKRKKRKKRKYVRSERSSFRRKKSLLATNFEAILYTKTTIPIPPHLLYPLGSRVRLPLLQISHDFPENFPAGRDVVVRLPREAIAGSLSKTRDRVARGGRAWRGEGGALIIMHDHRHGGGGGRQTRTRWVETEN